MTKERIEYLLSSDVILENEILTLFEKTKETAKRDYFVLMRLKQFAESDYMSLAKKNLKDKLSKM